MSVMVGKEILKDDIKGRKKLLIELICKEQTEMIVEDSSNYVSDKYKKLEEIKVRVKDL